MNQLILELMGKGTRWDFTQREIRIGRDPNCDVVLHTSEYPMVSRSHLLIRQAADRYWVEDLNTPGGTFINGQRIQVAPLSSEDVLRLGEDGPELRAHVSAAGRSESAQAPARRISSSEEATTRLRDGIPAVSSEEIPTDAGRPRTQRIVEGTQEESAPFQEKATGESLHPTQSLDSEAAPAIAHPDAASWSPPAASAFREAELEKTPSRASSTSPPNPVVDEPVAPQGAAIIEQRLNTIRNLLILTIVLILILGGVILYQMRTVK